MWRRPAADLNLIAQASLLAAGLACCTAPSLSAQVVLRLKNGDRISGEIIAEDETRLVLSNSWSSELTIPMEVIAQRELAGSRPSAVAAATAPLVPPPVVAPETAPLRPPPKYWRGEAQIGVDLRYGERDRQNFYAKLKLGYHRPYESDPALFFRNDLNYTLEYGRTENTGAAPGDDRWITSADRMDLNDKVGWDIHKRWYVYNLAGIGYDKARKVDLQYEAGPGLGYHLITRPNLAVNLEAGWNFQAQERSGSKDVEDFFYRFGQDLSWKPTARTTLTEKVEVFPRVNLNQVRVRFESTLSYDLWRNIAFNLTVLDLFDTEPAPGVSHNEVQVRSSVGVKF